MSARPQPSEAAEYYFRYINQVEGDDPLPVMESQLEQVMHLGSFISEEKSLHRYAPDKWSIRQMWNHINDTERVFAYRALWFARGYETALPSFEQEIAVATAKADDVAWRVHIEEFRAVRAATIALFRNLPPEAWERSGIASDNRVSVRALAYIIPGHFAHHTKILRERYL
jgi:DinB superfamily